MKLNAATYDALRLMIALAPGTSVLNRYYLSNVTGISPPSTYKLLGILSRSGLVSSERGLGGGYRLAKPASDITLYDIIKTMQGFSFTSCLDKKADLQIDPGDPLFQTLTGLQTQMGSVLEHITLSDLCGETTSEKSCETAV